MTFLQQIVEHELTEHSTKELENHIYIFPSKRAAAIFQEYLKNKTNDQAYIFPDIKTIQEFVIEESKLIIASELYLLQELFLIHQQITQNEQKFNQFASWGKLMLKDFDELDKYNINTDYFFNVLQAHKDVDEHFDLKELAQEYLQLFYKNLDNEKQGVFFDDFVKTWQFLGETYNVFKNKISSENFAYEGLAYRKLLNDIKQKHIRFKYTKIVFCGFNAFTLCEEHILDNLIAQYNVETWWDVDSLFLDNEIHEAGNFLRNYRKKYNADKHHWCFEKATNKNINIIAIPSNVGQIHYAKNQINTNEKNAIVLCDESLLDQALTIFDADDTNITMGLSIQKSNIYTILQDYLNCIIQTPEKQDQQNFYAHQVAKFLSNATFKPYINPENDLIKLSFLSFPINTNNISSYIDDERILNLFKSIEPKEIIHHCIEILDLIKPKNNDEKIIIQTLIDAFKIEKKLINYNIINTLKDIIWVIQNYIFSISIPFNTDRKCNTQIMGFLETRLLDYDNLYILNINDKNLPGTNKSNSFIPYNLRKSFQLPTFDQFDGVNAYHFYRLLKRAKNINLIYNNSSNSDSDNEKSRFIKQIEYEWDKNSNKITDINATLNNINFDYKKENWNIKKNKEIISLLKNYIYSASSLNTYLTCPVQFYLKYILKVYIPDELNTSKVAADFGTILHKLLEIYYANNVEPATITKQEIQQCFQQTVFALGYPANYFSGSNALQKKVAEKLFLDILAIDEKEDFELIGLEKEISASLFVNGNEIILKGKIDRLDKQNGNIRILDYKTGSVKLCDFPNLNDEKNTIDFFNKILNKTNTSYKETFQGLLYAWIYYKNYPNDNILVGYYTAKKLQDGIQFLNNGKPIDACILDKFEMVLIDIFQELFNENIPFELSENKNAYNYALAYKELLLI